MFQEPSSQQERMLLLSLNKLEKIKNKLQKTKNNSKIAEDVNEVMMDIKMQLQTQKINSNTFKDMSSEIKKLRAEKQRILQRHTEILITLEMLIYQKDYQDLSIRLSQFKAEELQQDTPLLTPRQLMDSSSNSKLDRAFMLDDQQKEDNQFLTYLGNTQRQSSNYRNAIEVINSNSPFEKKQEVWLEIMYSKNSNESLAQNDRLIKNEVFKGNKSQNELSQFSMITLPEDKLISKKQMSIGEIGRFSGKKVHSMILLKDRSKNKKKSNPKTSVKKNTDNPRNFQNAQHDITKLKKKLIFSSIKPQVQYENSSQKKKNFKQPQIKTAKSFRKTLISNL